MIDHGKANVSHNRTAQLVGQHYGYHIIFFHFFLGTWAAIFNRVAEEDRLGQHFAFETAGDGEDGDEVEENTSGRRRRG